MAGRDKENDLTSETRSFLHASVISNGRDD